MTPEEYAAHQAVISAAVARYVQQLAPVFPLEDMSWADWQRMLALLYPEIERRQYEAAELARDFYDVQRAEALPELEQNDAYLESYSFVRFVEGMEPARRRLKKMGARQDAITHLALRAVREVENAGRRQIIHAVEEDFDLQEFLDSAGRSGGSGGSDLVRGWARVATGRETCAWCLMLVSRGPTYLSARTSGLDLDDTTAQRMIAAGVDVSEHMNEWHTGCDCKVVPVFKRSAWPGQAAADRAYKLWENATEEAKARIESGKARSDNLNREAINALRRRLSRGEIDISEFAAFAA